MHTSDNPHIRKRAGSPDGHESQMTEITQLLSDRTLRPLSGIPGPLQRAILTSGKERVHRTDTLIRDPVHVLDHVQAHHQPGHHDRM